MKDSCGFSRQIFLKGNLQTLLSDQKDLFSDVVFVAYKEAVETLQKLVNMTVEKFVGQTMDVNEYFPGFIW